MHIKAITANLGVQNVAASVAFYTTHLDFKAVATVPDEAPYAWAMLVHGDTALMFQESGSLTEEYVPLRGKPTGGQFTLYLAVEGVQDWYGRLRTVADIILEPHTTFYGAREFSFRDADGYMLTLSESTPATP